MRATVTIRVPDAADSAAVERFIEGLPFKFGEGDEWLKAGPLKLVADGGILIGTSFMRKPFGRGGRELYAIDNPDDRGFLTLTPAQIAAAIGIIHRRGWQMVAHVTGDAGVDVVLDGIEAAQKQTPGRGRGPAAYGHSRILRQPGIRGARGAARRPGRHAARVALQGRRRAGGRRWAPTASRISSA